MVRARAMKWLESRSRSKPYGPKRIRVSCFRAIDAALKYRESMVCLDGHFRSSSEASRKRRDGVL